MCAHSWCTCWYNCLFLAWYCLALVSQSTVLFSNWFLRHLGLGEKCENNILLHHSGPHHLTKSVVIWMSFIIIVTLIFATSSVFRIVCCLYIYRCTRFTLREVIQLWQVSSWAGECSALNVAVKTSGRLHHETEMSHLSSSFIFLVIANQTYMIFIAKENTFCSKSKIKFMENCFTIYKAVFAKLFKII